MSSNCRNSMLLSHLWSQYAMTWSIHGPLLTKIHTVQQTVHIGKHINLADRQDTGCEHRYRSRTCTEA